jgi:hypothetical protein
MATASKKKKVAVAYDFGGIAQEAVWASTLKLYEIDSEKSCSTSDNIIGCSDFSNIKKRGNILIK